MKKKLYMILFILVHITYIGYADDILDKNISNKKISPKELLMKISSGASVKEIENYLKNGTKTVVDFQSLDRQPLFVAAKNNNIEMIKLLLKYNTSVDITTILGGTALHIASYLDHVEIVKLLLDAKANPFETNLAGYTSIELAKIKKSKKVMKLYTNMGLMRPYKEIKKDFVTNKKRFKDIFSKVSNKVDYDYKMKDIYGNEIKIKINQDGLLVHGLDDKIIIVDIFRYQCIPCKKMEYVYERLKKKYKDDIEIISIEVMNASDKRLKEIATNNGLTSIIISTSNSNNFINFIRDNVNWQGAVPLMVIIDKQHRLKKIAYGIKKLNDMIKIIDDIKR